MRGGSAVLPSTRSRVQSRETRTRTLPAASQTRRASLYAISRLSGRHSPASPHQPPGGAASASRPWGLELTGADRHVPLIPHCPDLSPFPGGYPSRMVMAVRGSAPSALRTPPRHCQVEWRSLSGPGAWIRAGSSGYRSCDQARYRDRPGDARGCRARPATWS